MTDQLNDVITVISERIKGLYAQGEELTRSPYQLGIQAASDYVTGQRLLAPRETRVFLEIFSGNTEVALRVLRAKLDPQAALLLPEGLHGLTLRFKGHSGDKQLCLYTTPLFDSWYYENRRSATPQPSIPT